MTKTKRTPKPARAFIQDRFQPEVPLATGEPTRLSTNIRKRRLAQELNYPALAAVCGVSANMIKQIEKGRRLPRLDALCAIAKALGATPSELLKGVQ